jgi:hypothetical protein
VSGAHGFQVVPIALEFGVGHFLHGDELWVALEKAFAREWGVPYENSELAGVDRGRHGLAARSSGSRRGRLENDVGRNIPTHPTALRCTELGDRCHEVVVSKAPDAQTAAQRAPAQLETRIATVVVIDHGEGT